MLGYKAHLNGKCVMYVYANYSLYSSGTDIVRKLCKCCINLEIHPCLLSFNNGENESHKKKILKADLAARRGDKIYCCSTMKNYFY